MRRRVKKAQQGLWGLLLIGLALCCTLPVTVRAEDADDTTAVVANIDELKAWLAENTQGGTVTLGAGIEITEPVRLYLCHVEAESALELPAFVTLDTCIVSEFISGGTVINRKITSVMPPMPLLLYLGEVPAGFFASNPVLCNITLATEGVADLSEPVDITFDDSKVDYNKPGVYTLPGVLQPPYDKFDLVASSSPLAITVTIYDPAIPYFYASGEIFGSFAISYYYSGEYEDLTLWRSDDDGDSWYVYWTYDAPKSEKFTVVDEDYCFHLIFTDPAELAAPALFVFEVGEGVGSDILYVDAKNVGIGGDRDSGDRIWLPWEFFTGKNPPPNTGGGTPNSGDEGSQGSGDDGTNSGGDNTANNDDGGGDDGNRYEGNTTPTTQSAPPQKAKVALIDLPAMFTPAAALAITATAPLNPPLAEETAPLESPSEHQPPVIPATAAVDTSVTAPGAPGEPQPEPLPALEPALEPEPQSEPPSALNPEPTPQPQVSPSSAATSPVPVFPIWAAGLMGMGGVGSLGYALHKRRRGR